MLRPTTYSVYLKPAVVRMLAFATFLLPSFLLNARTAEENAYWGTFHSPKGFGVCSEIQLSPDKFNNFVVDADIYALVLGRSIYPGLKTSFFHNTVIKEGSVADTPVRYDIYAGPGAAVGYLRDKCLRMGLTAGIAGCAGVRFRFPSDISISLYFQGELAAHLRFDRMTVGLYQNGLLRALYPQLQISYKF